MEKNYNLLIQFIAQLYKVGVQIEQFDIDESIIVKLSIPSESYAYTTDDGQKILIDEVNETFNQLFAKALYKLQIFYRVREENFSEQDGNNAYLSVLDDFNNSDFLNSFRRIKS